MNENLSLVLQLMLIAATNLQKWTDLVTTANAQGRDVTDEELNAASTDYYATHQQLDTTLQAGK